MSRYRFRIHERSRHHRLAVGERPDPVATVSGVSYQDLRQIFTAAALHAYDAQKKAKGKDDAEDIAYHEHMLRVLDGLKEAVDEGIRATFPRPRRVPVNLRDMPVVERRRLVDDARELRRLVDEMIADAQQAKTDGPTTAVG